MDRATKSMGLLVRPRKALLFAGALEQRATKTRILQHSPPTVVKHRPAMRCARNTSILGCLKSARASLLPKTPFNRVFARSIFSTRPLPASRGPLFRFFYRFFAYAGGFILVTGSLTVAFFLYDATTYRQDLSFTDISVSKEALFPERGGPKNLPIADVLVDDDDCEGSRSQKQKPKLVILGSGWGSVPLLKKLNPEDYHVTVISPVNYFLFTPMLPSATVGTLELRSLCEPIRRIVQRVRGHFLRAEAVDVEFSERLLEICQTDANGVKHNFYLPYDKLVIAVGKLKNISMVQVCRSSLLIRIGSTTNPHGVKGLENCHFLKTVDDARGIRNAVLQNLERACLPTTSDEERRRLLSFVVSGGGPTGVEFAAELFDLLNEDIGRSFPKILRNEVSVHVIQSRGHILNTYDETLSKYAEARFAHDQVEVLTNSRVKEVRPDKIIFSQKDEKGEVIDKELPMGFCLWSTGVCKLRRLGTWKNLQLMRTSPNRLL